MMAFALVLACCRPDAVTAPPEPELKLTIESPQPVLRPGHRMPLRFTLENASERVVRLEEPESYLSGLEIRDAAGKVLKPAAPAKGAASRARQVEPGAFFGRTVDIASAFPEPTPAAEGWHRIQWSYAGSVSNTISVWVMRDWIATLQTNHGSIEIEFLPRLAPAHVTRFLALARSGFYDGLSFHRIIPGFMMQGGMPKDPAAAPPPIAAEFSTAPHVFGTVSMARGPDPNSATSQFFICFGAVPHLDGAYTVFGQVVSGEEVVKEIERVKTDHDPCKKCGRPAPRSGPSSCCGTHHEDRPLQDVVIQKVTVTERKD